MSGNGAAGLENAKEMVGRFGPAAGALIVVIVLAMAGLSRVGCVNQHTPAGHEGYVRSKPIAGAGKFVGIQTGPTSTGWVWRQEVINIDVRPRTFSEEMTIPTADRLNVTLRAHARIRLRKSGVKEVVEKFGGENWYVNNVRDRFRSAVRDQVQRLEPFEVKNEMRHIGDNVLTAMVALYKDTPIEFVSIDVGDITYPSQVVDSVIKKFVTNEDNERKDIELEIAQKEIEIGIAEATGTRDAQQIIRTTLDPMYLQYEALQAIEQMSASPDTTFMIMPMGAGGNAPVIMNIGK
ncbi:MAG TPA: SPFH domain-containing protein [Kofleriaceae bacterium]|nr:SPFH domain-containing protein [Kofleriaceae bacterium]